MCGSDDEVFDFRFYRLEATTMKAFQKAESTLESDEIDWTIFVVAHYAMIRLFYGLLMGN